MTQNKFFVYKKTFVRNGTMAVVKFYYNRDRDKICSEIFFFSPRFQQDVGYDRIEKQMKSTIQSVRRHNYFTTVSFTQDDYYKILHITQQMSKKFKARAESMTLNDLLDGIKASEGICTIIEYPNGSSHLRLSYSFTDGEGEAHGATERIYLNQEQTSGLYHLFLTQTSGEDYCSLNWVILDEIDIENASDVLLLSKAETEAETSAEQG
ncbi:hypothetical protein QYF48_16290 [Brevibacillus agri]|uniref:hypothetical protein n=1 Tax=Brevibacillus agri TaxID=51101 RepID=UPI0025B6EB40|nr:hypothetical protein [Brevibacillus agri]MDN4094369.1 hypothetical protein [Brevibacillus agri]